MAMEDCEKKAFTIPYGLFLFTYMPFGLHGAPATFQRTLDKLLNGMRDFMSVYIDDVIVFSGMWSDHLEHLEAVLQKVQKAGLAVKRKKCQIAMPESDYLGHMVGSGKVRPENVDIQAIQNFERPTTKTQVRSILCLTGYYCRLIPEYAKIATPLTDLMR